MPLRVWGFETKANRDKLDDLLGQLLNTVHVLKLSRANSPLYPQKQKILLLYIILFRLLSSKSQNQAKIFASSLIISLITLQFELDFKAIRSSVET